MKDFSGWHRKKSQIESSGQQVLFREREVWWCSIGLNVGTEEDGKNERFERPVLIIRKFNTDLFWALPLTSTQKENEYYFKFHLHDRQSSVIISQLRTLSQKRLVRKIAKIGKIQFGEVLAIVQKQIQKQNGPLTGSSGA